jgi:hypothetical protein
MSVPLEPRSRYPSPEGESTPTYTFSLAVPSPTKIFPSARDIMDEVAASDIFNGVSPRTINLSLVISYITSYNADALSSPDAIVDPSILVRVLAENPSRASVGAELVLDAWNLTTPRHPSDNADGDAVDDRA